MPFQNRVHPYGSLLAASARGTMMGNRGGRFHDPATQQLLPKRRWASKQWICCVTSFKARRRHVFGQGYTELFFLDEATALAAGHRPCFECRRAAAKAFQSHLLAALGTSMGWDSLPKAAVIDALLHEERTASRQDSASPIDLPVGSFFQMGNQMGEDAIAKTPRGYQLWSLQGYGTPLFIDDQAKRTVLTPPALRAVLAQGYKPLWHDSAQG